MLTSRQHDQSKRRWDADAETGLKHEPAGVVNVEYHRDVLPILQRSCVACHTSKEGRSAAGNLDLDADGKLVQVPHVGKFPGSYYRLAVDAKAQFGHKPVIHNGTWRQTNASRYIRKFQSRRSLLIWKVYGERLDGWSNDDFPTASKPGDPNTLRQAGQPVANTQANRDRSDLDYRGKQMPPPDAVADGKVQPLSDEDRRTLVRWIDLGCPLDLDYDAEQPDRRGFGWMGDDKRPTLTLTYPRRGANSSLSRILIGATDYYSGLEEGSLTVKANFAIDGIAAGEELSGRFREQSPGVWEWTLTKPPGNLPEGTLTVAIKDRQGNVTRIERTFSVTAN